MLLTFVASLSNALLSVAEGRERNQLALRFLKKVESIAVKPACKPSTMLNAY